MSNPTSLNNGSFYVPGHGTTHFSTVWPPEPTTQRKLDIPCKYILSKKKLGDGSYSTVYECKNSATGSHYAAKKYSKRLVYGLEEMLQNEFHVLQRVSMSHPNILTLADYFETANHFFLVTDLCSGGELFDKIVNSDESKLSESLCKEITTTLVSTVAYLHANHIVHRDLKAENLLFHNRNSNRILIADFGLARVLHGDEKLFDISGTLSYMSPEMLSREKGHDYKVDVWAIGVIIYFMLCGYMPFDCETDEETKAAINSGDYRFEPAEYWDHISSDAKDFLRNCFEADPKKRLTAGELEAHPFAQVTKSHSEVRHSHSAVFQRNHSSSSLHHKLQEAFMSQNKSRGSSSNLSGGSDFLSVYGTGHSSNTSISVPKLSQIEKSRNNSLIEGTTLKGAFCTTPELVSQFTTPLNSTTASRQVSFTDLAMTPNSEPPRDSASPVSFFI